MGKVTNMGDIAFTKEELAALERRQEERDQDFIALYTERLKRICGDIIEVKKGRSHGQFRCYKMALL